MRRRSARKSAKTGLRNPISAPISPPRRRPAPPAPGERRTYRWLAKARTSMPVRAAAGDFGDASKARAGARAREPPLRLGSSFVRRAGASLRHGGGGARALPGRGGADEVSRQGRAPGGGGLKLGLGPRVDLHLRRRLPRRGPGVTAGPPPVGLPATADRLFRQVWIGACTLSPCTEPTHGFLAPCSTRDPWVGSVQGLAPCKGWLRAGVGSPTSADRSARSADRAAGAQAPWKGCHQPPGSVRTSRPGAADVVAQGRPPLAGEGFVRRLARRRAREAARGSGVPRRARARRHLGGTRVVHLLAL